MTEPAGASGQLPDLHRDGNAALGIEIFVADEQNEHPVDLGRWRELAERVVVEERVARGVGGALEISILFVDELVIADLNERFRGIDKATDVLSFSIDDADEEPQREGRMPDGGSASPTGPRGSDIESGEELPTLLGDIVICPHVAAQNAPDHAGSYENEIALLVVHGVLHLFGMDHEDEDEAMEMESRERQLLAKFYGEIPEHTWQDTHVSDADSDPEVRVSNSTHVDIDLADRHDADEDEDDEDDEDDEGDEDEDEDEDDKGVGDKSNG